LSGSLGDASEKPNIFEKNTPEKAKTGPESHTPKQNKRIFGDNPSPGLNFPSSLF
jgi:hypothetical protein